MLNGLILVKYFHPFFGTQNSLWHSQVPANCTTHSQLGPDHNATHHFLKVHLYIIIPFTPASPKCCPYTRIPHQIPVYNIPLPHTITRHEHYIMLDFINTKFWVSNLISFVSDNGRVPHPYKITAELYLCIY